MKIVRFETIRLAEIPSQIWVRVHTDEGPVGLGETCIGAETVEAHIHETIAPHLLGEDPLQTDRHSRTLYDLFVGYGGSSAETRGNSAVDIALWDIFGQAVGQPIYQLLGGAVRDRIRIYNTCAGYSYGRVNTGALLASDRARPEQWGLTQPSPGGPYEDLEGFIHRADELAQSLLEQGITGMKIWPFDPWAAASGGHAISADEIRKGLEPFEKIRAAVGSRMDVMLEMHAVWQLPAACRIAAAVEPFDPFWFEDPLKADNLDAIAAFARSTRVPVALGETLSTRWAFKGLLDKQAARIVMFDIGWVGGLSEARKIAAMAEAHNLPVAPHDCTGPVVLTASSHLALNAPNALIQETVRAFYTGWYCDVVTTLPTIADGYIAPPAGPGLGTALQPGFERREGAMVRSSTLRAV
ncbi:MAG: mandelate racemase/muconate lactonizing enzyme family protein [Candidatus Limnocylindrales bacterium]